MTQQLLKPEQGRRDPSEPLPRSSRRYRIPALPSPQQADSSVTEASSIHLSVVLPTYKERTNLPGMVTALSYLLDECLPNAYELIVVDDDSPDETWKVAQELAYYYPALRVIRRTNERGLATAVVSGWELARGEILGVIDTDLQQPPEVLLDLLARIEQGADLAIASRHAQGGGIRNLGPSQRLLSHTAQWLSRLVLPQVVKQVSDPMSGYFLVRREAIANRTLHPSGYKILLEVLSRGSIHSIAEVGYVFHGHQNRPKRRGFSKILGYLYHLLHLRLTPPSHIHQI